MTRKQLFYVTKKFFLSIEESLQIYKQFENETLPDNDNEIIDFLIDKLNSLAYQEKDIELSLRYFFILNKLEEDDYDEGVNLDDDENEVVHILQNNISLKHIEDRIMSEGIDKFKIEVVDYIVKKSPNILKCADSLKFQNSYREYLTRLGIDKYWQLSQDFRFWLRDRNSQIENEFNKRVLDYEKSNIIDISKQYIDWASRQNVNKHTKGAIREYLKFNNLKLTEISINNLKDIVNER